MGYQTTNPLLDIEAYRVRVATHIFEIFQDRCLKCKMPLLHVLSATPEDVGAEGFSCIGTLTTEELNQINAYKARFLAAARS